MELPSDCFSRACWCTKQDIVIGVVEGMEYLRLFSVNQQVMMPI